MIDRVDKAGNGRAQCRLSILLAEYRRSQVCCALCGGSVRRGIARIERISGVFVAFEEWFGEVEVRGCELYRYRRLAGAR